MANHVESYIEVKNADQKVIDELVRIFTPKEGAYEVDTLELVNRIHGTNWSYRDSKPDWDQQVDFPTSEWWETHVGPKWVTAGDSEFELDNTVIRLTSAWAFPYAFVSKLIEHINQIKPDCYFVGTYEEEVAEDLGAFVFSQKDKYVESLESEQAIEILETLEESEPFTDQNGDEWQDGWDWFHGSVEGYERLRDLSVDLQNEIEEDYLANLEEY